MRDRSFGHGAISRNPHWKGGLQSPSKYYFTVLQTCPRRKVKGAGPRPQPKSRRSPGVENGVELQRVHVIACDKLQAQLQVPADDVARTDSEHKTVVVAEIVSCAADQLDVRRDQIPRHSGGPGAVG